MKIEYQVMNSDVKPSSPSAVVEHCPVHPHNNVVGHCRRCQQTFCDVCESRWQKENLCLACFTKIIERKDPTPGERLTQQREATTSLVLSIAGLGGVRGEFLDVLEHLRRQGEQGSLPS